MELPNAHLARIDRRKLTDYLLNSQHPGNGGKARFFHSMGFYPKNWPDLESALCHAARSGRIVGIDVSEHGRKYIQDAFIASPEGREHGVRMIWILENDIAFPRLVTAYPMKGVSDDSRA